MAHANSSHDNLNPGFEITQKNNSNEQLQKIEDGSRDGNAKKYSNKGGRDGNKYNRHPYITHSHVYTLTHSSSHVHRQKPKRPHTIDAH